jgi:uncharacterized protein (TIGR03437 family)
LAGDGGLATNASVSAPPDIALDGNSNLYVIDGTNARIRVVNSAGIISAFAGGGTSLTDGLATQAFLIGPTGLEIDSQGRLLVALSLGHQVRRITPQGAITTIAGLIPTSSAAENLVATSAPLLDPFGVAVDATGVYISDVSDHRVLKISAAGIMNTVAGNGLFGGSGDGGPATNAQVGAPRGLGFDPSGRLLVTSGFGGVVRRIATDGTITKMAGGNGAGFSGDGGNAVLAQLFTPIGIAADTAGDIYIGDSNNHRVRRVDSLGKITTLAGTGDAGFGGDAGSAALAKLFLPNQLALDSSNNLYVADVGNVRIRKITPSGTITTVAGNGVTGSAGDGGPATAAQLALPYGVAVDAVGNLFIASNLRIRRVDAATGVITTIAGNGIAGYSGDGGLATFASINGPRNLALDSAGNIYFTDEGNSRVRKLAPVDSAPSITTVANAFGDSPTIAPNTWVTIKGSNLAPVGKLRIWLDADFVNNQMPTALDGVSVTMGGKSAFVYYISGNQLNVLTPPDLPTGPVQVQVTSGNLKSASITVPAQALSESFFVYNGGPYVVAVHLDGSRIGPPSLFPGLTTPAKPGEKIVLFANGFGPTSVPVQSASVAQSGTLTPLPAIKIGGVNATVEFAGLISPGLFQFNIVVPDSVPDGDNVLTVSYNGLSTQAGVLLSVQR